MRKNDLTPPPRLPDGVAAQIARLDEHTLRETISYIRDVLEHYSHQEREHEIEAIPEDELVRVTEHEAEGYVEIVRGHRCTLGCSDCPHGPFLYHVRPVRRPDGGESLQWTLIGPINDA